MQAFFVGVKIFVSKLKFGYLLHFFSSKQIIGTYIEEIRKFYDIACFRFVHAALPVVNGFLTYSDRVAESALGYALFKS